MSARKQKAPGPFARSVAAEVRSIMAAKRITAMSLAASAGVSQNYLSKRLRDEMPFTLEDIDILARHLGSSPAGLIQAAGERLRKADNDGGTI